MENKFIKLSMILEVHEDIDKLKNWNIVLSI